METRLGSAARGFFHWQAEKTAASSGTLGEGRAAFNARAYATACAKLAESQRLESSASTLFNLAYCEENRGQLVSAWQHYREGYLHLPPTDERLPIAKTWLAGLESRLPRLTVRLADGAPAEARVHIGDVELPSASL